MEANVRHCDVTFAVACFNALPFLDSAIGSALSQQDVEVEVIIVDDGSTDGSLEMALGWQKKDRRVRVFRTPRNLGPGGARNIAIRNMQGQWLAVLDSDDVIDPRRSRTLIDAAEEAGADLIADNLTIFGQGLADADFLKSEDIPHRRIDLDTYFKSSRMFGRVPNLGFLKPMIRQSTLEAQTIQYNENLRIGEDDELIVRLLINGLWYAYHPDKMYRYRKHANSISHRLSLESAERILVSERAIRDRLSRNAPLSDAYAARWRSIQRAVAFTRAVDALKQGSVVGALLALASNPAAITLFAMPLRARFARWCGT